MEDILPKITDKLLSSLKGSYPVGLFHGKMGLAIYLYHLSKSESNPDYQSIAAELLDQILLRDLSANHSIDVEDGLAGIGLGITYLIKKQFVEGNINELLEVIDNAIYRRIAFQKDLSGFSAIRLLHLTGYWYLRLKEQTDTDKQILYQDIIINLLNMLHKQIDDEFLCEPHAFSIYHYPLPVLLWVFSKLIEAGFYNDRIYKMLDELKIRILARFPRLHSNRLYLLWGMLNLKPFLHDIAWDKYIQLLFREIRLDEIFAYERKDRKIFIENGLAGTYILLHLIKKNFSEYQIPFDPQTIFDKIQNSDAWNALLEREYFFEIHQGLLNGFPGVQLVLSHIKQHDL